MLASVIAAPSQQLPLFKLLERSIETDSDRDFGAGGAHCILGLDLKLGWFIAVCFQLQPVGFAVVDNDQIRNTGAPPETFQNRSFDWRATAAISNMKPVRRPRSAQTQMLQHSALDRIFRALAAAGHCHCCDLIMPHYR